MKTMLWLLMEVLARVAKINAFFFDLMFNIQRELVWPLFYEAYDYYNVLDKGEQDGDEAAIGV